MNKDYSFYDIINYLRFPLIVGVVFVHFNIGAGFTINDTTYGVGFPQWYYDIIHCVSVTIGGSCVPTFFFISGYLFFKNSFDLSVYKKKLLSRGKSLLIPYILWNCFAILIIMLPFLPIVSSFFPNAANIKTAINFENLSMAFIDYNHHPNLIVYDNFSIVNEPPFPINIPLWYIRELMIMVIFSPILFYLIKRLGFFFVSICCLGYLLSPSNNYLYLLSIALFFFSFGAYFNIKKVEVMDFIEKSKLVLILYPIMLIAEVLTSRSGGGILLRMTIIAGLLAFLCLGMKLYRMNHKNYISYISKATFFVFTIHYVIIGIIEKILFSLMPISNSPYHILGMYIIIPCVTIIICIISYACCNMLLPKMCKVLTGGR